MLRIKACSRCEGDLTLVLDLGESYFSCVQCGQVTYVEAARPAPPLDVPAARAS
ncbi:MAG: hypothetical protein O3C25_03650 [Chloroflexi bacterium]|nr:hypothetical protein [Chloroflexota bacterium]